MSQEILNEALTKASEARDNFIAKYGEPFYCGFAWVDVTARSNSKLGQLLQENGFRKGLSESSGAVLTLWDPSNHMGQSMDVKIEGAKAYAKHLTENGIPCEWRSRGD